MERKGLWAAAASRAGYHAAAPDVLPASASGLSGQRADRLLAWDCDNVCGIAGFTHYGRPSPGGAIQLATETLRHRGGDQLGHLVAGEASLGVARLAIIDPDYGRQPMRTEDGATAVVFNGELYNYLELRERLEALGHVFRTDCDTEVLLRAFAEWDVDCFPKLTGMFAAAFWQQRKRRLVLVRDRLGIKPLYYRCWRGNLYFGSELKAIFAHAQLPRTICAEALARFLCLNYIPGPLTLIDGIRKVEPGTWLEFQAGECAERRYWQNSFHPQPCRIEDACEELGGLLSRSVREHLRADVPVGLWLSGGLDSSTILHYASEHASGPLRTFSVSFRGRNCDERRYFRLLASRYGTQHEEVDLNEDLDLNEAIHRMAFYSDEPSADAGALPAWFLSQLTAGSVRVALSGEGADELFGGYHTYLADRCAPLMRMLPRALTQLAARAARRLPVSDEKIGFEYKLKRFLEGSLLPPDEAHLFWNGTSAWEEQLRLRNGAAGCSLSALADLEGLPPRSQLLNRYLFLDQHYYLPDDILYKCDRMSMAHSLEVRPPFLDHRIVEFAGRLPADLKIRGFKTKFILRQLTREFLPQPIVRRNKEGLDIPAHDWLRGPLRPLLLETLSPDAVAAAGLVDPAVVAALIGRHLERRSNVGYHLWGLITLHLWVRRWKVETELPADDDLRHAFAITTG